MDDIVLSEATETKRKNDQGKGRGEGDLLLKVKNVTKVRILTIIRFLCVKLCWPGKYSSSPAFPGVQIACLDLNVPKWFRAFLMASFPSAFLELLILAEESKPAPGGSYYMTILWSAS